jgi:hypothetical protein
MMGSLGIAKATAALMATAALIFFLFSTSSHAGLSNRTKQAGPTVKHAFRILWSSRQTRKQARQTVTKWQFTLFPSKSSSCYNDCSISPSKQAMLLLTNYPFKSLEDCYSNDGCSISPSKQAILTNFCDDCSTSPSSQRSNRSMIALLAHQSKHSNCSTIALPPLLSSHNFRLKPLSICLCVRLLLPLKHRLLHRRLLPTTRLLHRLLLKLLSTILHLRRCLLLKPLSICLCV